MTSDPSEIVRTARATVRVPIPDPAVTANAIRPDDTAEIQTIGAENHVVVTIDRDSIGSLQSTVDDIIVNLTVATKTAQLSDRNDKSTNNE